LHRAALLALDEQFGPSSGARDQADESERGDARE
jgi:hypothetical protein